MKDILKAVLRDLHNEELLSIFKNLKRHPMNFTVSNDYKTVWVNSEERCLARFCPISQEFFNNDNSLDSIPHYQRKPTKTDWENFCKEMHEHF
jgi:hypothetical protein